MPTLEQITVAVDQVTKLIGVALPAVAGVRAGIITLLSLYTSRRPKREDGTAWTDREISEFIQREAQALVEDAVAVRLRYDDLLARRQARRGL